MRHSSGLRALGIAGALAILLTACSTTGAPTGGGAPTGPTATDPGKSFVFASTQFSPVTEQEAMRKKILTGWNGASVEFITDQEPVIIDRITVESKAGGTGQIGIVGLENGQFGSLVAANYLNDLAKVTTRNADKKINSDMLTLGKFGGSTQLYVPWMQNTYFLAANKKASSGNTPIRSRPRTPSCRSRCNLKRSGSASTTRLGSSTSSRRSPMTSSRRPRPPDPRAATT